jgi:hypothetical protein
MRPSLRICRRVRELMRRIAAASGSVSSLGISVNDFAPLRGHLAYGLAESEINSSRSRCFRLATEEGVIEAADFRNDDATAEVWLLALPRQVDASKGCGTASM